MGKAEGETNAPAPPGAERDLGHGQPVVGVDHAGIGRINQGYIEGSNVNVVEELVNMISAQRIYETNSKVISTADRMLGTINQAVS